MTSAQVQGQEVMSQLKHSEKVSLNSFHLFVASNPGRTGGCPRHGEVHLLYTGCDSTADLNPTLQHRRAQEESSPNILAHHDPVKLAHRLDHQRGQAGLSTGV